ncbi:uncharacterized protein [Rutidosis leptorrhynchoides]|uniref:uncharacterized protein n=1 Tax=Rutidosis leptorrhynchoides TaxID=125765 RepID=UPI003A99D84B
MRVVYDIPDRSVKLKKPLNPSLLLILHELNAFSCCAVHHLAHGRKAYASMTTISSRRDGKHKADQIGEEGYLPEFGYRIRRLHMDTSSSVEIMYEQCFRQLPEIVKRGIRPSTMALSGFSGESAWPIGTLDLKLELRDDNDKLNARTEDVEFCVMHAHSRYNAILGRIPLQRFGAIPSTVHGLVKFLTKQGIATLESNPLEDQKVKIGAGLMKEAKAKLRNILMTNLDVFCWRDADMTGVPRDVAQHHLNVNLTPVWEKRRPMAPDMSEWLRGEVNQLVKANFLCKVNYQTWVANPVLVLKADGSWRLCVDFKDINKACPKDNYPLPEIYWKVESLARFQFKCFL